MTANSVGVLHSRAHVQERTRPPTLGGYIPALDGLRGIGMLLVMYYHCALFSPVGNIETQFKTLLQLAIHSMDVFFVLSGFLITGILLDSKGKSHFLRNFYARRTLRIFPLYYAFLAIGVVVAPWIITSGDWPWYVLYASNVMMVLKGLRPEFLAVTWSLAVEEQFYLVAAVTVRFLSRKRLLAVCAFAIVGALLVRVAMWLAGFTMIQIFIFTPCRVDMLAWGAGLAIYMRSSNYRPLETYKAALVTFFPTAAVFVILYIFWFRMNPESPAWFTAGYTLVGAICAQTVVLALHSPTFSRILSWRPLLFFGKYSYGIYLIHIPVRDLLLRVFFNNGRVEGWFSFPMERYLVFYALETLAVIPPALISWHLFEKQFLKLKSFFPSGSDIGVAKRMVAP